MNKLGAENPYVNAPDWSEGLAYDEQGQHDANRTPGDVGAGALAAIVSLPKSLVTAKLTEIPGVVWNGAKSLVQKGGNALTGIKNWWKGADDVTGVLKGKSPKGLIGKDFEDFLVDKYGGRGGFSVAGRQFDGAVGTRWWEAKSGSYWETFDQAKFAKFRSDMGHRLRIARDNGATYELHSNVPIPQHVKDYLTKKGIPFFEHLE